MAQTLDAQAGGRRGILFALKKRGRARADELAGQLGITPTAVRQHLAGLLADDLVVYEELRAGPGRPKHVYRLTATADALFPRTYSELTNELLDYAGTTRPGLVDDLFEMRRQRRVDGARARLIGLDFDDRVAELTRILDDDGYLADAERLADGSWRIVEHNCAILGVAERFGQACSSEIGFLHDVLPEAEVERTHHMMAGAHMCAYAVRRRPVGRGMSGPLEGVRIVELAGIGPGPFAAMLLADMGADIVRVDRVQAVRAEVPDRPSADLLNRGRRSIGVDLKHRDGVATVLRLVDQADILIEGFRPGVTERLGVGPADCLARNPKLVYGRMTGWGQDGPYAAAAGHDINYIALSGTLDLIGRRGSPPTPPLNLVGDFGGGAMFLAFGVVCALLEAGRSGQGQVVDAAMVDGSALLATMFHGMRQIGQWNSERGTNLLDTGAPFYEVYECSDGRFVSIGSIEPQFYAELLRLTGLDAQPDLPDRQDRTQWPVLHERLTAVFRTRTRDEWCSRMEHTDVCFAPVLTVEEAPDHPHNAARHTFTDIAGLTQPAPAPRFSRTPAATPRPPAHAGQHTDEALADWGFAHAEIEKLRAVGAIA